MIIHKVSGVYNSNFTKFSLKFSGNASPDVKANIPEQVPQNKEFKGSQTMVLWGSLLPIAAAGIVLGLRKNLFKNDSVKKIKGASISGFEVLNNDSNIPTLHNCKSINKKLKTFLQNQIDLSKATPEDLAATGAPKLENRLLLYGAPGSGKTFFAKIFAKTLDANYKEIKYSDLNDVYLGRHLDNIKDCFDNIIKTANKNPEQRFVVTFNEIDSMVLPIGRISKGQDGHSAFKVEERSVFLNYLDEISIKAPNVTIIGTTNVSPKNQGLDGAAMSRFKNLMEVSYPDKECLREALKANIADVKGGQSFIDENPKQIEDIVELMKNRKFSYRDLNAVTDGSKRLFLRDYLNDKNSKFKYEYLEKALKDIDLTDGEIAGVA